jgi:hypothetical protein
MGADRLKTVADEFRLQLQQWKQLEREAIAAEMHAALFLKERDNTPEAMRVVDHSIDLRQKADDYLAEILGGKPSSIVTSRPAMNDAGRLAL